MLPSKQNNPTGFSAIKLHRPGKLLLLVMYNLHPCVKAGNMATLIASLTKQTGTKKSELARVDQLLSFTVEYQVIILPYVSLFHRLACITSRWHLMLYICVLCLASA